MWTLHLPLPRAPRQVLPPTIRGGCRIGPRRRLPPPLVPTSSLRLHQLHLRPHLLQRLRLRQLRLSQRLCLSQHQRRRSPQHPLSQLSPRRHLHPRPRRRPPR